MNTKKVRGKFVQIIYVYYCLPAGSVVLHSFGNSLYNKGCKLKEVVTDEKDTEAGTN